jgi:hypothetical protein
MVSNLASQPSLSWAWLSSAPAYLFKILALTIQIGNLITAFFLVSLFYPTPYEIILCVCFYVRTLNSQLQGVCLLLISTTRFTQLLFPTRFSKLNHFIIGLLIKISIAIIPAYILFVVPLFVTPAVVQSQPIELRTLSSTVELSSSTPATAAPSYSVGLVTGLITILGITFKQTNLVLALYFEANILYFVFLELFMSIFLPLGWCVANPDIKTEVI